MRNTNKEQILFILCLVILGLMGYYRFADQKRAARVSNKLGNLELVAPALCADIQFIDKGLEFYMKKGRNVYAPPRDWLPLEALVLDVPPQLDLLIVSPFTLPGLGEAHFDAYHYLPKIIVEETGEDEGEGEFKSEEDEELARIAAEAEAINEEEAKKLAMEILGQTTPEEEEEGEEAQLLAMYDWIQLNDQVSRIWGHIKNEEKYDLLKNKDPIRFEMVAVSSGKAYAPHDYTRDRIAEFGFADTVVNRIELAIRALNFNAGMIPVIIEKANWCLSLVEEDSVALDYAIKLLERSLELDPLSKESYNLLADVHLMNYDTESAFRVIKSAVDRRLNSAGVYVRYGRLLRKFGLNDAALEAFKEAEKIKPKFAESLVERAFLALEQRKYAQAHQLFEDALLSPNWDNSLKQAVILGQAQSLFALNRLPEAMNKVQRAINLDDEHGDAWNLKGAIALATSDLEAAEEAFNTAIDLSPIRYDYMTNLAITSFKKKDYASAREKLDQAIDMDPYHSAYPITVQGFISQCFGDGEAASSAFDQAIEINPAEFYALYLKGRDLIENGDMVTAIEVLKKALRLNSNMNDILTQLGRACLLAGKAEDAGFYFEEYLKRTQGDFRVHYLYGLSLIAQNRLLDSIEVFKKAMALADKENPDPYNGLAYSYYSTGDVDACLTAFGEVLRSFEEESQDPRYLYAKKWLERIEEHRRKSQWLDDFQRKEIKNEWDLQQRSGPIVNLINNEVVIQGTQRQEQPDERTDVRRVVNGREFRAFEIDLCMKEGNQASMALFVGIYLSRGAIGMSTKAEVALRIAPNGEVSYNVVDKGQNAVEWAPIEHEKVQIGQTVRLGLEITDYEKGLVRLTLDGEPLLDEDLLVKDFRKNSRDSRAGFYAAAPGSRKVFITADNARVVVKH